MRTIRMLPSSPSKSQEEEVAKWEYLLGVYLRAHKNYGLQHHVMLALSELTTHDFHTQLKYEKENQSSDWAVTSLRNTFSSMVLTARIDSKILLEISRALPLDCLVEQAS